MWLTQSQIGANRQHWKTGSRVEPIFGIQQMGAGNLMIGTRSLARAKAKIGWTNLADNIDRYCLWASLVAIGAAVLRQIVIILPEAIQF